jgi:hypothetical protein
LCKRTALHILALELLLDDLPSSLAHDRRLLGVLLQQGILITQVDLVADEDFRHVANVLLQLRVPLNQRGSTFLRALTKEEGSITEKTIRKTSQLG